MTIIPSSIEVAFLWNIKHGLLGDAAKQYIADHPDHEERLLSAFRLGGNDLVKLLIERDIDFAFFEGDADGVVLFHHQFPFERGADTQPAEPEPITPLSTAEALLISQLRDGHTDEAAETLTELLTPEPTWREKVKNVEHYLLAFGIAGALVRNGVVDVDLFDVHWHRTFENIVATIEDSLNLLNT